MKSRSLQGNRSCYTLLYMKKLTAVRLDEDVIQRITELAEKEGRTLSGEIVRLLGVGLEAATGSAALVPDTERKKVVIKPRSAGVSSMVAKSVQTPRVEVEHPPFIAGAK